MRLFKQSYLDKNTKQLKQVKKWSIEFKDHYHQVKRLAAFSDKARTMELARKIESLVMCR